MQEKSLPFSPKAAAEVANSPQGQQLIRQLQKYGGDSLRAAAEKARQGDMESVQKTLAPLLQDPQIQALLKSLGGNP